MEEFRPVTVDSLVLRLLATGQSAPATSPSTRPAARAAG
ncbi:hypothetical protein [Streptomyces spiralis]